MIPFPWRFRARDLSAVIVVVPNDPELIPDLKVALPSCARGVGTPSVRGVPTLPIRWISKPFGRARYYSPVCLLIVGTRISLTGGAAFDKIAACSQTCGASCQRGRGEREASRGDADSGDNERRSILECRELLQLTLTPGRPIFNSRMSTVRIRNAETAAEWRRPHDLRDNESWLVLDLCFQILKMELRNLPGKYAAQMDGFTSPRWTAI